MSLKVWLPLNGNLENQGASAIIATNVNATINTSGKIGSCYNFAGSGQRIKMTNPITNGINTFSICTWFYMTAASEALWGARTSSSGAGLLCFLYADSILFDDGTRFTCSYNVNNLLNSWHHIACVKTPTQKIIYIDGVSIGIQNTTAVTANIKNEITIGNDSYENYTDNDLIGKLNDFRIYDHALSAAEVHEISQGLVLHYKLDDITNGKIQDSSGYGHNGTILGNLSISSDAPRYSASAIFNGTDTKIQVPNITPAELTISFWMKRNANTGTRQFMYTAWYGITCELQTDGIPTFAVNRSSYSTITGTVITTDNGWVHYCATFDTTNGSKLYQNGVLKSSNSDITPIIYNISTNYIGYYNTYYNGKMSDFRIYCTALSAADIKQLYEVGAKVDNKQNLHIYESIESSSTIKLTKRGQAKAGEFQENTNTKFYETDQIIETNNLIEF